MSIRNYFESVKKNKAKLRQFIADMPKGGDLHNHLIGAAYAETFFEISCRNGLYVNLSTGKLYKEKPANELIGETSMDNIIQLSETMENLHSVRMTLIDKWSIRDFQPYKYPLGPDEYFFSLFGLFIAAAEEGEYLSDLVHELRVRAKEENVQYIETIGLAPNVSGTAFLTNEEFEKQSATIKKLCCEYNSNPLYAMQELENLINTAIEHYDSLFSDEQSELHQAVLAYVSANKKMATKESDKKTDYLTSRFDTTDISDDDVMIKFQGYASRDKNPLIVLSQLYIIHRAITIIPHILVGCNIVAAENSENSMLYYKAHMLMFKVLRRKFNVKTAVHAGELTMGLIPPEHLTYHISDAVNISEANRIGHGTDIVFEHNSNDIIKKMKEKNIAVEINLTSNEFILGVKDDSHPFSIYKSGGVPMVISTDDPGILRTSLTEEYTIAIYRYDLNYDELKELVWNSIKYSFLSESDKETVTKAYIQKLSEFENRYEAFNNSDINM